MNKGFGVMEFMIVILLVGVTLGIVNQEANCRFQTVVKEGYKSTDERDIFLECLSRTKSSVTHANDDEDTDDTIDACSKHANYTVYQTKRICN